jgi:hypothetical protein
MSDFVASQEKFYVIHVDLMKENCLERSAGEA